MIHPAVAPVTMNGALDCHSTDLPDHLMKLLALNCQHCSAPLQIPPEAKFVTCTHCGSQLAVRRTGSVAYTEALEAIDERTARMAEQLDDLHRQSALSALDQRWQREREQFYLTGKEGRRYLPTKAGSIAGGLMVAAFGTVWTIIACGMGGMMGRGGGAFGLIGTVFPLFGIAFVAFGLWQAFHGYQTAEKHERAKAHYQRERRRLLENTGEENIGEQETWPTIDE